MVTLKLSPQQADLRQVQAKLSLSPEQIDPAFGVVSISPEQNLFAILVDADVADRLEGGSEIAGTFSNPKIEPFNL